MPIPRLVATLAAVLTLTVAPARAFAQPIDGQCSGASSIAGGTGDCWGNNPASAIVSGGTITIRYVAYDGSQEPVTANLKPDGSFTASQAIKGGAISYAGKVTPKRVTAQWKGPVCWGTLDMER